jgi:hypothetical protein
VKGGLGELDANMKGMGGLEYLKAVMWRRLSRIQRRGLHS